MTNAETQQFNRMSKQRVDYESLPGGGQRARMTVTLPPTAGYPKGRTFVFVEDLQAQDVKQYATQIAGVEIGFAMQENGGYVSGVEVGSIFSDIGKAISGGVKAIGKVAKAVVTSKVMQTAAKGLAIAAPALGPLAPMALGASAGIGIAGKLLSSKTAKSVGAPRAAQALAASAVSDAKRLTKTPGGALSLLKVASTKASNAFGLVDKLQNAKLSPAGDILAHARAGRVRSNTGGQVTPAQLQAAASMGRVFFVAA